MQCSMLHLKVYKEIDRINKNFLCSDTTTKRKIHRLNWHSVTKPKPLGGHMKESSHRDKALLVKRLWDIWTNPNGLHALMLSKKYPPNNQCSKHLSSTWSSLCMVKSICDKGTRWLIHNGASINFWYDNWTGSGPLRNSIQGLFNMCESALTVIC